MPRALVSEVEAALVDDLVSAMSAENLQLSERDDYVALSSVITAKLAGRARRPGRCPRPRRSPTWPLRSPRAVTRERPRQTRSLGPAMIVAEILNRIRARLALIASRGMFDGEGRPFTA